MKPSGNFALTFAPVNSARRVFGTIPANFGFSLWVVYGVWVAIIVALYPVCRWYADLKKRRKDWWLGYL